MVGGYQIVEIGTGIVGMYDKLKAAYEAKKPILVQKNGIKTFGNVTKDGNYFVANYIIDDVLHQDTISALDAITDSSIDIGGSAGDIEALEEAVATLQKVGVSGTYANVADQSSTLPITYTCPSDGYIRHYNNSLPSAGNVQTLLAERSGTNSGCVIGELNSTTATGGVSTYVRKGQKIIVAGGSTALTGGSFNVRFYPFEN